MEHESHLPEESNLAITIFGWLIALVLIGGLLYIVYQKSGLAPFDVETAYDNCKTGILQGGNGKGITFLSTPENVKVYDHADGHTLVMKLRLNEGGMVRDVDFSCNIPKQKPFANLF